MADVTGCMWCNAFRHRPWAPGTYPHRANESHDYVTHALLQPFIPVSHHATAVVRPSPLSYLQSRRGNEKTALGLMRQESRRESGRPLCEKKTDLAVVGFARSGRGRMARNRANLSTLQKAYDNSYLICSTAVYYEGQARLIS